MSVVHRLVSGLGVKLCKSSHGARVQLEPEHRGFLHELRLPNQIGLADALLLNHPIAGHDGHPALVPDVVGVALEWRPRLDVSGDVHLHSDGTGNLERPAAGDAAMASAADIGEGNVV